jgi:hypothetical protein
MPGYEIAGFRSLDRKRRRNDSDDHELGLDLQEPPRSEAMKRADELPAVSRSITHTHAVKDAGGRRNTPSL